MPETNDQMNTREKYTILRLEYCPINRVERESLSQLKIISELYDDALRWCREVARLLCGDIADVGSSVLKFRACA